MPVCAACKDVFAVREMQSWPPELIVPDSWSDPYATLAKELGLGIANVEQAASKVRDFIREIAGA